MKVVEETFLFLLLLFCLQNSITVNKGEKNDTQSASCPCSSLGKTHNVQTDYGGMWNCKTVVSNEATTPGGSAPLGAPIPSAG